MNLNVLIVVGVKINFPSAAKFDIGWSLAEQPPQDKGLKPKIQQQQVVKDDQVQGIVPLNKPNQKSTDETEGEVVNEKTHSPRKESPTKSKSPKMSKEATALPAKSDCPKKPNDVNTDDMICINNNDETASPPKSAKSHSPELPKDVPADQDATEGEEDNEEVRYVAGGYLRKFLHTRHICRE